MTQKTIASITSSLLAVAVLCIAALIFYIHFMCSGDGREGGSDKREWSILQSLEVTHRGQPISDIEFHDFEQYHIICIPAATSRKRIWIMLNPESPTYYKQLSEAESEYFLLPDQLSQITRARHTISTVEDCLGSHVRHQQ